MPVTSLSYGYVGVIKWRRLKWAGWSRAFNGYERELLMIERFKIQGQKNHIKSHHLNYADFFGIFKSLFDCEN